MSRSSAETPQNPARKFFKWAGGKKKGKGRIKYFDKSLGEKGEEVYQKLPFGFLVLDDLTTITGFDKKEDSGFWSNEVKSVDLKSAVFTVRSKSGIRATGKYEDLDHIKSKGAKYAKSLYIAYYEKNEESGKKELVIGNLQLSGAAVSAWIKFLQENGIKGNAIYKGRFAIMEAKLEENGETEYYAPVYAYSDDVPAEANEEAKELDRQLQEYLALYFKAQGSTVNSNGHSSDYTGTGEEEDYRTERDRLLNEGETHPNAPKDEVSAGNPVARSLSELATNKQFNMIKGLCKEKGVDINGECFNVFQCKADELSKKAASAFIAHLQELPEADEDAFDNMSKKKTETVDDDFPPFD